MKKFLCLILILLALCGCATESPTESVDPSATPGKSTGTIDFDGVQTVELNGVTVLKVWQSVCKYKDGNIAYLLVENVSEKNYNVTINGNYVSENGSTIAQETRNFTGFPKQYKNYFLFNPEKAFDDFSYTIELTEFDGEAIAQYITMGTTASCSTTWGHINKNGEWFIPTGAEEVANSPKKVCISFGVGPMVFNKKYIWDYNVDIVLFNAEGEAIHVGYRGQGNCNFIVGYEYIIGAIPLLTTDIDAEYIDDYEIPEEYKNITGFIALRDCKVK